MFYYKRGSEKQFNAQFDYEPLIAHYRWNNLTLFHLIFLRD